MRAAPVLALSVLLAGCLGGSAPSEPVREDAGPGSTGRLARLLADPGGEGFARAVGPREFVFPRDHGPHPEFRHEWWYLTGHLQAAAGERFGFELTFFRIALVPPASLEAAGQMDATAADATSSWRAHQIYMAHFAVTDLDRRDFRFTERYARGALGLAGAQSTPLRVWLEDWSLEARGEDRWRLRAEGGGYDLALDLRALQPPVLNGNRGLSRKSAEAGAASYYYSIPRLEARGRLVRNGSGSESFELDGLVWLDREWGSGALGADQVGWDWFAVQLEDGSSLMFYALRRRDGRRDAFSAGTWVDTAGHTRPLASAEVAIEALDHWVSPRGGRYPARWRLRIPALELELELRPLLADQELDTSPRYWEGAVSASGSRRGAPIAGRGYVELVGYAH